MGLFSKSPQTWLAGASALAFRDEKMTSLHRYVGKGSLYQIRFVAYDSDEGAVEQGCWMKPLSTIRAMRQFQLHLAKDGEISCKSMFRHDTEICNPAIKS